MSSEQFVVPYLNIANWYSNLIGCRRLVMTGSATYAHAHAEACDRGTTRGRSFPDTVIFADRINVPET